MIITKAVIYAAGAALLASLAWGGVQCSQKQAARLDASRAQTALERLRADVADAARKAERDARLAEQASARRLAEVAARYEQEKIDAQAAADRITADLRAGNVSLHRRWQACAATADLSGASAAAGQPDGGADDRAASAVRIVRAAAQCDAQVRGLQDVVRADREAR